MAGCIIHFGMHKTGSSSIQQSLLHADDLGPDHRFIATGAENGNLSRQLLAAFADEAWRRKMFRKQGAVREEILRNRAHVRARLIEDVAAAGERTAILSAEAVPSFGERELRRLARTLERTAGSVSAVGYVRAPAEWMASSFQQQLKGGYDSFAPAVPNYRRLEVFDTVLGRENVSLWKFDPARFPEGDVVRDFCARLGIPIAADDVVRVNEALSLPAISILFAYRVYGPGYGVGRRAVRENRALSDVLREVPGPRFRFHESVVAPVLEANREDLAWIEDRLGEELRSKSLGSDGVSSAEELLEIEPSALSAYFDALQNRYGIELPGSASARDDTDPHAVAANVQACREAIGELLFGSVKHGQERRTRGALARNGHRKLVAQAGASAGRWREAGKDSILFAPTPQQPAVVGLEAAPATSETGEAEFTAHVRSKDAAPLVLRLSVAGGGEEGRVLDEISVAGPVDREWTVPVPISPDQSLQLSASVESGRPKDRRARVRVTRPTLGPAA